MDQFVTVYFSSDCQFRLCKMHYAHSDSAEHRSVQRRIQPVRDGVCSDIDADGFDSGKEESHILEYELFGQRTGIGEIRTIYGAEVDGIGFNTGYEFAEHNSVVEGAQNTMDVVIIGDWKIEIDRARAIGIDVGIW